MTVSNHMMPYDIELAPVKNEITSISVISEVNNTRRNILSAMTCVCVCEWG